MYMKNPPLGPPSRDSCLGGFFNIGGTTIVSANCFRYPGDYVGGTDHMVPRNLRAVGQNCTRRMLDESFCHSNALRLRGDEFFQSSCER